MDSLEMSQAQINVFNSKYIAMKSSHLSCAGGKCQIVLFSKGISLWYRYSADTLLLLLVIWMGLTLLPLGEYLPSIGEFINGSVVYALPCSIMKIQLEWSATMSGVHPLATCAPMDMTDR